MKRILAIIASVTLLLLCWEALDDITTGDQQHLVLECRASDRLDELPAA